MRRPHAWRARTTSRGLVGTRLAPIRVVHLVRKLTLWLAGLAGGGVLACSGPTSPGEMPPLAPRPDPMQPIPSHPNPKAPVPGAPDPLRPKRPDAGAPMTEVPAPQFEGGAVTIPMQQPADAGVSDAVVLPPGVLDALPSDANKRPESTAFHCC